jgi:hypothetical protein
MKTPPRPEKMEIPFNISLRARLQPLNAYLLNRIIHPSEKISMLSVRQFANLFYGFACSLGNLRVVMNWKQLKAIS